MLYVFLEFTLLVVIVIFTSIRLSKNAEIIEENSKVNPVFMGLILAGATSLPEVVSSVTSLYLGNDALAVSNLLGSNVFNIFSLALFNLFFFKDLIFKKVKKETFNPTMFAIIMYLLFIFSFVSANTFHIILPIGHFAITTLLITGIYFYSVYTSKESEEDIKANKVIHLGIKPVTDRKLRQVKIRFFITIVVIVISSIFLAHTAEKIIEVTSLSASAVGALLIGISTSLPNIITCYALLKSKKYSMAISSIIGSNTFNFFTFTLLDYMSRDIIYKHLDSTVFYYAISGLIISLILYFSKYIPKKLYFLPTIFIIAIYLGIVFLSF